jgi:Xylose isomerase-like TIM barrel
VRPSLHYGLCGDDAAATVRFCEDTRVRDLVCDINQIPGRKAKGCLTREDLHAFTHPFSDAGISLSVVTVGRLARDASGDPNESDLDAVCRDIAALGEEGVPVAQLFDLGSIPNAADREAYRDRLYRSYARIVAACAGAGVRLAIHAGWRPEHALWNTACYLALFEAVPDPHNGVCFCAGSVYQSGDDVVATVHRLADRIHFVHFRDAEGIGGDCPEMLLGTGRVPFAATAAALREVGYGGVVHCEHFGRFGSDRTGEAAAAWGAGFMSGLFQSR